MKKQKKDQANSNDIIEKKAGALQEANDELQQQLARNVANDKRRHEKSEQRLGKLQEKFNAVVIDMEGLTAKIEEQLEWEKEAFQIRHTDQRYTCNPDPTLIRTLTPPLFL
jgi:hypothetical protein